MRGDVPESGESAGEGPERLHPTVVRAGSGQAPGWAVAGEERRAHMERVASLLRVWAEELELSRRDVIRWTALGWLHDALRDASPEELRPRVEVGLRDLPPELLHGPAAAARLREEGVEDDDLLRAVRYHTLGHPELDRMGRALYAADFLEPGRSLLPEWRAVLRARMPHELDPVVREIVDVRVEHLLARQGSVRPETRAFQRRMRVIT